MRADDVADKLEEIATYLELDGANGFKIRAYQNGARIVRGLGEQLPKILEAGRLADVDGIGKTLLTTITELANTGHIAKLDELREIYPPTLLEVLRIPGLGPKKAKLLYDELAVASLADLERAIRQDELVGIKGFGKKTQDNLVRGIELARARRGKFLLADALPPALELLAFLRGQEAVARAELAGSARRGKEVVHDVDLLTAVAADSRERIAAAITGHGLVAETIARGDTKVAVRLVSGLQVDVRMVEPTQWAPALAYFTGSKAHNVRLRGIALKAGYTLNEYALTNLKTGEALTFDDEAGLYDQLGLPFIHPELREDAGEIEAAREGKLPRLLEEQEIRGIFHVHSTWSDGRASVMEMVRAAAEAGFEYVGLSDHAGVGGYARALTGERLRAQRPEVQAAREAHPEIAVYHGAEVDILADGSLALPDEDLAELDFVIAGAHMAFRLERDAQTERLKKAVSHPRVTLLAHPTGRRVLDREPVDVDLEQVVDAAVRHGCVIELNAHPYRIDLAGAPARRARDRGARFAVNPDAHSTGGMRYVRNGVAAARRAWLEASDVINTMSRAEMDAWLAERRASGGPL